MGEWVVTFAGHACLNEQVQFIYSVLMALYIFFLKKAESSQQNGGEATENWTEKSAEIQVHRATHT